MNQQWQADIFLDSGGESINAVEGKLLFPADLLSVKTISDGNSAVNLWIEKPRLESAGSIGFSGITPGGYGGRQGLVFSVVFSAEKEGGGALAFAQTRALLNDGEGTAAPIATSGWPFMISSQLPAPALAAPPDTSPPEEFFPQITRNAELFNGQWFLVFAAADKGSGIAGYEVKETRNTNPKAGKWLPTESPYLLQDQGLTSYIYIKAADQAGNGRIETIKPRHPSAPGPNNISLAWAIAGAAIFLIGAGYVIIILWRKKNKRHSKS